jgi:hypothetical protein
MPTILEPATTVDLCKRIMQEYRDLPALCLTVPQAARLFQVEVARCVEALQELENAGCLHRIGQRYFSVGKGVDEEPRAR